MQKLLGLIKTSESRAAPLMCAPGTKLSQNRKFCRAKPSAGRDEPDQPPRRPRAPRRWKL